ncbi:predicted protein [Sclerotinia sclerotiorum 1980 UF-70]|uniref:Uncharacterized protein n=1 Tax=Sclerotinia sclerotiorum (strain ATCC 18683 / 1980 / Ss-1) TaxID=665079 RepID=A7EBH9_SCLS1|nr:predicted protein [Sclerotinia sclerotiorum 1980 UF-70]EDN99807.1 predicted protein [Sclerotinia sclerotiorum 1980 UF-70]
MPYRTSYYSYTGIDALFLEQDKHLIWHENVRDVLNG